MVCGAFAIEEKAKSVYLSAFYHSGLSSLESLTAEGSTNIEIINTLNAKIIIPGKDKSSNSAPNIMTALTTPVSEAERFLEFGVTYCFFPQCGHSIPPLNHMIRLKAFEYGHF